MGWLGIDNSKIGELPKYGLEGVSDAVTQVMKRRDQKREFEATQLLERESQARLKAQHDATMKAQKSALDQADRHHVDEMRAKGLIVARKGAGEVQARIAAGDFAGAEATAAMYGLPFTTTTGDALLPMERGPQEPQAPQEPKPPELKVMADRAPPPVAADEALDAYLPEQSPFPTEPPPQGAPFTPDLAAAQQKSRFALQDWESRSSSQEAQRGEAERAIAQENSQAQQKYEADKASLPQRQKDFETYSKSIPALEAKHRAHFNQSLRMPDGSEVPLGRYDESRNHREIQAQQLANAHLPRLEAELGKAQLLASNSPDLPQQRQALGRVQQLQAEINEVQTVVASVMAGADDPAKAGAALRDMSKNRLVDTRGRELTADRIDASKENARVMAAGAGRRAATVDDHKTTEAIARAAAKRSQLLRQDIDRMVVNWGTKDANDAVRKMPNVITNLNSGNAKLEQAALAKLWISTQGDTRYSDKDHKLAEAVNPSYFGRIANYANQKFTSRGLLSPDFRAEAIKAAKFIQGYYNEKLADQRAMFKSQFIDSGLYDRHEADVLGAQRMPGWVRLTGQGEGPVGARDVTGGKGPAPIKQGATAADPDEEALNRVGR